ncbi:MAG: AMP-binding protein [Methylacidiphilales bacterium]|nr:AMP-binding protein [Candidatus Methylacidiphilales bacterium]
MKADHSENGTSFSRSLLRRQGDLLRHYLERTVIPFSKHYAPLANDLRRIRSVEDLCHLDFTVKRDVQEHPLDFILVPDRHVLARRPSTILKALWKGRPAVEESFEREFRPTFMTFTTGRAAQPLPFLYTDHDLRHLRDSGRRIMSICGAKREMKMVNMFPYAPHLAFWQSHYAGTEFGVLMVGSGGGKVAGTEGNLRLMQKLAPEVLIGMPTFIYHVMQAALARNIRCPQLSKIILGGEKAPSGMRRKLKALATQLGAGHVDTLMIYGFTEAKMAWPECCYPEEEGSGGFHLYPDLAIIEIVDPKTGEPVGEGRPGEIVFTPLDARGTVVLRYRTGDLIEGGLVYEPCPHCGRHLPRLVGRISRSSEVKEMRLDKLKGTLVDFNELEHVLDNFDSIGTWQLELRKANDDPLELDELILHVEKSDHGDEALLRHELNERIASVIEMHPNRIIFESAEQMRGLQGVGVQLKEQRLVDHRPKPDPNATGSLNRMGNGNGAKP